MGPVAIPHTMKVVCDAWEEAERVVAKDVCIHFPKADERAITQQFQVRLSECFDQASRRGHISRAFEYDLTIAGVASLSANRLAEGLIVEASWHAPNTEKLSGADMGLTLGRPLIVLADHGSSIEYLTSALLVQAKKRGIGKKWNELSERQEELLPPQMDYAALLLYELNDPQGRVLEAFKWALCRGFSLADLQHWLRAGEFPTLLSSTEILNGLSAETIGTTNRERISQSVTPEGTPTLKVRIDWRDGHPVSCLVSTEIQENIHVHIHSGR
jgi:hypothetical protein